MRDVAKACGVNCLIGMELLLTGMFQKGIPYRGSGSW